MKKYRLTRETKSVDGHVLHRIERVKPFLKFFYVGTGEKGGWIEKESNLRHHSTCWVADEACVFGNAVVSDSAIVEGYARVYDNARIRHFAVVSDHAWVAGDAVVDQQATVRERSLVHDYASVTCEADISGSACVYGQANVCGHAQVGDHALVRDNANIGQCSVISGSARLGGGIYVHGNAKIIGDVEIEATIHIDGDVVIESDNDYFIAKNNWSSGRYFMWTKSNDMWIVGCFRGTGKELIDKAYKDSEDKGKHYEAVVNLVEQFKEIEKQKHEIESR